VIPADNPITPERVALGAEVVALYDEGGIANPARAAQVRVLALTAAERAEEALIPLHLPGVRLPVASLLPRRPPTP